MGGAGGGGRCWGLQEVAIHQYCMIATQFVGRFKRHIAEPRAWSCLGVELREMEIIFLITWYHWASDGGHWALKVLFCRASPVLQGCGHAG